MENLSNSLDSTLKTTLSSALETLEALREENECKSVLISDKYIRVAEGKGINGTNIAINDFISAKDVKIFDSKKEAFLTNQLFIQVEKKDGKCEGISLRVSSCWNFLTKRINEVKQTLSFLQK